jgi:hypothetical protein
MLRIALVFGLAVLAPLPASARAFLSSDEEERIESLRRLLPATPDPAGAMERLRFLALGGDVPAASPVRGTRAAIVPRFECTAREPRDLGGPRPEWTLQAVPLDCEAESRGAMQAGVIRLADAITRSSRVFLIERLRFEASSDSLRLRVELLAPSFPDPVGVDGDALAAGLLETIAWLGKDRDTPVRALANLLTSGDAMMTSIELQGSWALDGGSYRPSSPQAWKASALGTAASGGIFQWELERERAGVNAWLARKGGITRRRAGACTAVEMHGEWRTAEPRDLGARPASAPAPHAAGAAGPVGKESPAPTVWTAGDALAGRELLLDEELCRDSRDPIERRVTVAPVSGDGPLTLRLRDVDLADVFRTLGELTGQGFVVDEDVVGRSTVDFSRVTLEQALGALERSAGLSVSRPGWIRRVSTGPAARAWVAPVDPVYKARGEPLAGFPITFDFKRGSVSDLLLLAGDISGRPVEGPPSVSERVTIRVSDGPWVRLYAALLDTLGMRLEPSPTRLRVRRGEDPIGLLAARTRGDRQRRAVGLWDTRFAGLAANAGKRYVAFYPPNRELRLAEAGFRFWNGSVKSVADDHAVVGWECPSGRGVEEALLRVSLASASDHVAASAVAKESPVAAWYGEATSGKAGDPVDARSRLAFHRSLIQHLRSLGGEEDALRKAVRDSLAAAATTDVASDVELARQGALIANEAAELKETSADLWARLRTLGPAFESGALDAALEDRWPVEVLLPAARRRSELALAEQIARRNLLVLEVRQGPDPLSSPVAFLAEMNLAEILEARGKQAEALVNWDHVVELLTRDQTRGPLHASVAYATAVEATGRLRSRSGDWRGALDRYVQALVTRARTLGAGHVDVLKSPIFTEALTWSDAEARGEAAARLRQELAACADPAAAAWYPILWDAEWLAVADAATLASLRERVGGDLARLRLMAPAPPDLSATVERGEEYLRPYVAWLRVRRLRHDAGEWVAETVETPHSQDGWSTSAGPVRELRAGDRLAEGVVVHVSPLGLFVEAVANDWRNGKTRRQLLRCLPPERLPAIRLGRSTTRTTRPLLTDGTPDYAAWLNARFGAGVTPDNNAAPPLREALAGLRDTGKTFWDELGFRGEDRTNWAGQRAMSRSWVDEECPECVARLERNEQALARIAVALERPRYFTPLPEGVQLSTVAMPSLLPVRLAANALTGRGMLRLGKGDLTGAVEDSLLTQKLALTVGQGFRVLEALIGVSVRMIGAPLLVQLANAPGLDLPRARHLLQELGDLAPMPDIAEAFETERLWALDSALGRRRSVAERGGAGLVFTWKGDLVVEGLADPELACLVSASSVDWDEVLRLVNGTYDRGPALARASSAQRARAEAEARRLQRGVETLQAEIGQRIRSEVKVATDDDAARGALADASAEALDSIGRTPDGRRRLAMLFAAPPLTRGRVSWNESETQFRLAVLALALAAHRLETGNFPERLEALAGHRLSGRLAPAAPLPGYTLRYERRAASASGQARPDYVLVAMPEEKNETGVRGMCVDATGALRFTPDGSEPKVVNGACAD